MAYLGASGQPLAPGEPVRKDKGHGNSQEKEEKRVTTPNPCGDAERLVQRAEGSSVMRGASQRGRQGSEAGPKSTYAPSKGSD